MCHYLPSFFSSHFEGSCYGEPKSAVTLLLQFSLVLQYKLTFVVKGFPDTRSSSGSDVLKGIVLVVPQEKGIQKKGMKQK